MIRYLAPSLLATAFLTFLTAQTPPPTPQPKTQTPPRRGFAGAGEDYKHYSPEVLEAGTKYYTANCAFCHGGSAKGGESGPDLLRSVVVLHDENGEVLGAFIKVGRPDKGMPKFTLPDEQVKDIAAFLHEHVRQAAERAGYQIQNIVVGDAKAGEAYFNGAGGCTSCHSLDKDLAHIGTRYQPVDLQQKIIMPEGNRSRSITAKITQPNGQVLEGRMLHIDDFSITIEQADGDRKVIPRTSDQTPKVELTDPMKGHTKLLGQYSDSDIHNLTAFLVTLK